MHTPPLVPGHRPAAGLQVARGAARARGLTPGRPGAAALSHATPDAAYCSPCLLNVRTAAGQSWSEIVKPFQTPASSHAPPSQASEPVVIPDSLVAVQAYVMWEDAGKPQVHAQLTASWAQSASWGSTSLLGLHQLAQLCFQQLKQPLQPLCACLRQPASGAALHMLNANKRSRRELTLAPPRAT